MYVQSLQLKMDKYVKHHKKPHAKYLNVDDFNKV